MHYSNQLLEESDVNPSDSVEPSESSEATWTSRSMVSKLEGDGGASTVVRVECEDSMRVEGEDSVRSWMIGMLDPSEFWTPCLRFVKSGLTSGTPCVVKNSVAQA